MVDYRNGEWGGKAPLGYLNQRDGNNKSMSQGHSPIESPQPIFDPEINDPRKFTLVIGDHGVTQC
jgi:hypothetical protein